LFASLGHRVDAGAAARDGDETGLGRGIAVPDVVPHGLEEPGPLPGGRVERDQGVRVQVVTGTVGAVEVRGGGSRGRVEDPARFVQGHSRPVVGAAAVLPGVAGPRLVARLARMRDGVEGPAPLARADVEGADVARRGGQSLAYSSAHDEQVLVDDAGRGEADGLFRGWPSQVLRQVDAATAAEALDGTPGARVEGVHV